MKREIATEIVDSLKEAGIDFVATLTEANLHELVMTLGEDPAIHHVPVTREEEGIGICAGAYLGGKRPAMVMMNSGFLLSTNALATVCLHPGIPVLMLIGHSGGVGEENASHATVGALTVLIEDQRSGDAAPKTSTAESTDGASPWARAGRMTGLRTR